MHKSKEPKDRENLNEKVSMQMWPKTLSTKKRKKKATDFSNKEILKCL